MTLQEISNTTCHFIWHIKRGKVSGIENMYLRLWGIAEIGERSRRGKERVAFSPQHQHGNLHSAQR